MADVLVELAGRRRGPDGRPARVRNAIGLATMDALDAGAGRRGRRPTSLVIRGGGDRAFISGGDLKELAKIRTQTEAVAMALRMRRLCDRIATFPAPVIAALNGHALGGGAEVAVAADIRVAADDVTIGFNQATLAIMPGLGRRRAAGRAGRAGPRPCCSRPRASGSTPPRRTGSAWSTASTRARRSSTSWRALARPDRRVPGPAHQVGHRPGGPAPPPGTRAVGRGAFAALWTSDAHWAAVEAPTPGTPTLPRPGRLPEAPAAPPSHEPQ